MGCECVECVYFNIEIGGKDVGRITAQLRADVVPMTVGVCVGGGAGGFAMGCVLCEVCIF